ncbi:MAG: hypothetical protein R6X32_20050 [Chloroflexota bacterium]
MRGLRVVLPLLLAVMALVWWQQLLLANIGAETAVDRPHEAIILPGDTFADWLGVSLEELALYRYRDGAWEPVPFQIDEVDETGSYVAQFDGLLGANDELVFMSADSGTWVSPTLWVSDSLALQRPRYVITITDPLEPEAMGWVYLYRSTTLPRSDTSYVNWDNEAQTATAVSYTLSFTPDDFLGLASLSLNDQPQDVLDRQKLRLEGELFGFGFSRTEESILELIDEPVTLTLPITGPIRAVGRSDLQQAVFYGQQTSLGFTFSLDDLPIGTTVHNLRLSLDLANPETSGLAPVTYYDSNLPAGVAVDGSPDAVPEQPLADWQQIDGVYGGFVSLLTVSADSGQTGTYYLDDDTLDPDDTGDGRSYGDAGFFITNPEGLLQVQQTVYFLAGQQGNLGQTFAQQAANPLQTNSSQQPSPIEPEPSPYTLFLPFVLGS